MIWLVGLAAACMTLRASVMALPTALILLATGVTFYEFPAHFHDVVVSDHIGVALLVLRNGLLIVASLIACRRLWVSAVGTTPDRAVARAGGAEAGSEPESDRLITW
jgi:hypothetical protein